jgi:prephenate dehydrogenase
LVGSEKKGVKHARADLYHEATVVLTPIEGTDQGALEEVRELWSSLGATVELLSPEEHDSILAQTSHVPHLVAAALVNALARGWGHYVGPGFLDTTRVAASDPALWKHIFLSNAGDVVRSLARFRRELLALENALAAEPEMLEKLLARSQSARRSLDADSGATDSVAPSATPAKKKRPSPRRGS